MWGKLNKFTMLICYSFKVGGRVCNFPLHTMWIHRVGGSASMILIKISTKRSMLFFFWFFQFEHSFNTSECTTYVILCLLICGKNYFLPVKQQLVFLHVSKCGCHDWPELQVCSGHLAPRRTGDLSLGGQGNCRVAIPK